MSVTPSSTRPLANLKQAIRQCRAERAQHRRHYAAATESLYPSLQTRYPPPTPGFRPSQAIKQNRFEIGLRKIPVIPPPPSTAKVVPDPIASLTSLQLSTLDPASSRRRLFSALNPDRARVGDILLVRLKSGEPFSGVCINIRARSSPIDTAVLLRNNLTRVAVEMWFKIFSPGVSGIEVVRRKEGRRARRAKLYYMRLPKHDIGSVEGVTRTYLRGRQGGAPTGGGGGANKGKKKLKN
nr:hypothetical protein B0A51_08279 [Rachicladosporium sp. CCFEE 5018]